MGRHLRLVALLIPIVLIAANSHAAVKAGSACKKVGSKSVSGGKSYTCIKSGKKLVWDKGVLVPVSKPAPAPSASASPTSVPQTSEPKVNFTAWSTTATGLEITQAAQAEFRKWAANQTKENSRHVLLLQPGVPSQRAANFSAADKLGSKVFDAVLNEKTVTIIGTDQSWVVQRLRENGGNYQDCSQNAGNAGLEYCLDGGNTQGYVVKSDMSFQPSSLGSDGSSLLAHEFFHIVQYQMADTSRKPFIRDGNAFTKDLFPAWLVEGSANFVGFSVAALAMGTRYEESRNAMFRYAPLEPSMNRNAIEDYEIRNGSGNNSPTYPYIIGQFATEYLVASVGFQPLLDIFIDFRSSRNFEQSFKKAIGISKEDFYAKFEKARTNMGFPDVSWKLVCLTNTPISEVSSVTTKCSLDTNLDGTNQQRNPNGNGLPPPVDRNSNVENLGCMLRDEPITNNFGSFICKSKPDGNTLWHRAG